MKKKPPRALSLVLALALSLAACGTGAAPQPQGDTVPLPPSTPKKEPAEVAAPMIPSASPFLGGAPLPSLDYLQTTSAARCPAWAPSKRPAWRPSWPVAPT